MGGGKGGRKGDVTILRKQYSQVVAAAQDRKWKGGWTGGVGRRRKKASGRNAPSPLLLSTPPSFTTDLPSTKRTLGGWGDGGGGGGGGRGGRVG